MAYRQSLSGSTVLILGSSGFKDYEIARSLSRAGCHVTVAQDPHTKASILKSRHVDDVVSLPDKTAPLPWSSRMKRLVEQRSFDLIVPTDDYAILNLFAHCEDILNDRHVMLPPRSAWEATYKKDITYDIAGSLRVPLPKAANIYDVCEIGSKTKGFGLPVVIKPLSAKVRGAGGFFWLKHTYACDRASFLAQAQKLLEFSPISVQECFTGVGEGQGFICDRGRIVGGCQYTRVHEPPRGGPSTYRKTVPLDQELLRHSENILRAIGFHGPVMMEYKRNRDTGRFVLIEINGRFWGSLPLAVAAGFDAPRMAAELFLCDRVRTTAQYKAEVYCRHVIPDLWWIGANRNVGPGARHLIKVPPSAIAKGYGNILRGRERADGVHLDDPYVAAATLAEIGGWFFGRAHGYVKRSVRSVVSTITY